MVSSAMANVTRIARVGSPPGRIFSSISENGSIRCWLNATRTRGAPTAVLIAEDRVAPMIPARTSLGQAPMPISTYGSERNMIAGTRAAKHTARAT